MFNRKKKFETINSVTFKRDVAQTTQYLTIFLRKNQNNSLTVYFSFKDANNVPLDLFLLKLRKNYNIEEINDLIPKLFFKPLKFNYNNESLLKTLMIEFTQKDWYI